MEIEVDPESINELWTHSTSDEDKKNESIVTLHHLLFWVSGASQEERLAQAKPDESNMILIAAIFLALVGITASVFVLRQRRGGDEHHRQRGAAVRKNKRPPRPQQQECRLKRANSSFADLYHDLRSQDNIRQESGILGRIRSATAGYYYWSSSNHNMTKLRRPSSMDISDNIQRMYMDSDADRMDREADEGLFTRVLDHRAAIGPLQAGKSHHPSTPFASNGFLGPTVSSVQYRTWIPPPSWAEASRRFVANREAYHHLARNLSWEFGAEPMLKETVASKRKLTDRQRRMVESSIPIAQVRLEVHRPVEMGVLYLHREDSVAEHSFRSAQVAAQFQTDITMLQSCGNYIYSLFQALVIAQNGSLSSAVSEPIFNCEKGGEDNVNEQGVAWADVMQCLGNEMPCIRFRLDALMYMEGARQQESILLQPEYHRKRLLLGPIDFFRLFVPSLPETAVPIADSNRMRTEHVLRVRKRLARAAVLVHAFVTARCVVNHGWQITSTISRTRRMAFDDAIDNEQYDLTCQKEYYETNQKQGYALVGVHSLPWNGPVDPVLSFRSLRTLVEDHPHLHFLIESFYMESQELVTVKIFVRSLPRGIDRTFDSCINALIDGDKTYRDVHLQMGIHLGLFREGLSLLGRLLLMLLAIVVRWEIGHFPSMGSNGTLLPILNLSTIAARTLHFGGSLCTNESLPNNYVAFTAILGPQKQNLLSRMILLFLELGIFSKIVANINVNLLNCKRPLSTLRLVRDPTVNAKMLSVANSIKTAYELFFQRRQHIEVPEVEDIQGSFGECSLASLSAERRRHRDALGDATRRVIDQIERSRDLSFILDEFRAEDVRRFLVDSNGKVKLAVSRLASTALWRREVFPIDVRKCRIELQSGQLFFYGQDNEGCPVMYFRHMCLGPWRKNADATISAVLHCFDTTLSSFAQEDPNVRLTIVVLLGRPLKSEPDGKPQTTEHDEISVQGTADSTATHGTGTLLLSNKEKLNNSWNPRVKQDELWYPHTNQKVVQRLIEIVRNHYPGRLQKVLLVSGSGCRMARSAMGRKLAIRRAVPDSKLRNKIVFIPRNKDIQKFVEPSQIPGFVGGTPSSTIANLNER